MSVAHSHEWELLLGEAWWRGIVALPETAESRIGRALWNHMRLILQVMGCAIVDLSVKDLKMSVTPRLGQEGEPALTTSWPKWLRSRITTYIF